MALRRISMPFGSKMMRAAGALLMLAWVGLASAAIPTVTITGRVLLPSGAATKSGVLTAKLSQAGSALDGATSHRVASSVRATLGADGSLPASWGLVPNDAILPVGTYYAVDVTVWDDRGVPYRWTEKWQIASSPSSIDIGAVPRLDVVPGVAAQLATAWPALSAAAVASAQDSAASSAGSATTAGSSASASASSAASSASAQAAAEAARDSGRYWTQIFASSAAGIASTSNGQYFGVPSADSDYVVSINKNNGGVAQFVNATISASGVDRRVADKNVGQVISGMIDPSAVGTYTRRVQVTISTGTVVEYPQATPVALTFLDPVRVTLTPGTFFMVDADALPGGSSLLYIWANTAGTVFCTPYSSITSGGVLIAYASYYQQTNSFNFRPFKPTLHMYGGSLVDKSLLRAPRDRLDFDFVEDFGADTVTTTGTSNLAALFNVAAYMRQRSSYAMPITVRVPPGTYVLPTGTLTGVNLMKVRFIGADRETTIFKSADLTQLTKWNYNFAEGITFYNVVQAGYLPPDVTHFKHCKFKIDAAASGLGALYWVSAGGAAGGTAEVEDNVFENGTRVYISIYVGPGAKNVTIRNNTLTGDASHVIRAIDLQRGGRVEVTGNVVATGASGFTTGIFFGSTRGAPIENLLIEGNTISGFVEEGISLDGFGNNEGLVPVICNGTVTSAANDGSGRLVITPTMVYRNGGVEAPCSVSLRSDWTTYYATLGEGTGAAAGTIAKVLSFDAGAGTITLDSFAPSSSVTLGGDFGVQTGFFNPVIRGNVLWGGYGASNNYATALSLWLNVFGALVENNTVYGGANGINLGGGLMLSSYYTLAWGNLVRNNRFIQTNRVAVGLGNGGAIRAVSYYGGHKQYGNVFEGNLLVGGTAYVEKQGLFRWEGNVLQDAALALRYCGNTLPTADASQIGRRFMLITDDGSGVPTAVSYWMVKLSGGTYTWVAAP